MRMPLRCLMIAVAILLGWGGIARVAAQPAHTVIVVDNGTQPLPAAVEEILDKTPALKIAIAWPPAAEPSDTIRRLVQRGQILPLMTITDEPALSLIDESDAREIVADARRSFATFFPDTPVYLYLRSGVCTASLPPRARSWGVDCVVAANTPLAGAVGRAVRADDTLFLLAGSPGAAPAGACGKQVAASSDTVAVIALRGSSQLKPSYLSQLYNAMRVSANHAVSLPSDGVFMAHCAALPETALPVTVPDGTLPADLWKAVVAARADIETYARSGQASVRNLAMAREELFHAYSLEHLRRVSASDDPAARQGFTAGMRNIYRLIGMPFPEAGSAAQGEEVLQEKSSSFMVSRTTDSLVILNAEADGGGPHLAGFSVRLTRDHIVYEAAVTSAPWVAPMILDVYIDMNNQRGAGATALLSGLAAFVPDADGWEYAIRMERYQITLYRAGRGMPAIIKTFKTVKPFSCEIPRSLLRGTPLGWRYQALVAARAPDTTGWIIQDFLYTDAAQRRRIYRSNPLEIPLMDGRNHDTHSSGR